MLERENPVLEDVEDIEVQLFIDGIYYRYGYDFRNYSRAHMKRRILHRINKGNHRSITHLLHEILRDEALFRQVLPEFSINVTEMFRDPEFFLYFREHVVPELHKRSEIRIWHAGCASGEEVYSMAILLREEGLYDKVEIIATDFNEKSLEKGVSGIYSRDNIKEYARSYKHSGGKGALSDYYSQSYDTVAMDPSLKENIRFMNHNLVDGSAMDEVDLIICRNVLIYFNRNLQDHVLQLFNSSLVHRGILCLGTKETIDYSSVSSRFRTLENTLKVYRKDY